MLSTFYHCRHFIKFSPLLVGDKCSVPYHGNNGQQLTVISQNSQTKLIAWNSAGIANIMVKRVKKRKKKDRSVIVFHFPFRKLNILLFSFFAKKILVCAILVNDIHNFHVDIPKMFVPFKWKMKFFMITFALHKFSIFSECSNCCELWEKIIKQSELSVFRSFRIQIIRLNEDTSCLVSCETSVVGFSDFV